MTWSKLSEEDRRNIIAAYKAKPSSEMIVELAAQYDLNVSSLERKIRGLKQGGAIGAQVPDSYSITNVTVKGESTFVLVGDIHIPHHDVTASNAFFRSLDIIEPDMVVFMGDILDMYSLSTFNKHPERATSANVQHEIDMWFDWYEEMADHLPTNITQYALFGNHEERYERWLMESPAVHNLEVLRLANLMRFSEYGIDGFYDEIRINPKPNRDYPDAMLYLRHGTSALKNASSSSRKEAESLGYTNLAVGHVHRLSVTFRRTDRGQASMAETGCLCALTPTYIMFPDWTQGFVYGKMDAENIISLNTAKIQAGRTAVNGVTVNGF